MAKRITTEEFINKAHEIYGNPLPKNIEERLEAELAGIIGGGYEANYTARFRNV